MEVNHIDLLKLKPGVIFITKQDKTYMATPDTIDSGRAFNIQENRCDFVDVNDIISLYEKTWNLKL